jgi:hypothetical protein
MSVIWLVFILLGSPWTGLMWVVSLAFAAAIWASGPAAQLSEPVPATATRLPATMPASKTDL